MINMYVGNLPKDFVTRDLFNLFDEHGWVDSLFIVDDPETRESKGFGFVQMPDEDAKKAIKAVNGKKVKGMTLRVEEARPQEDKKDKD
jgi:RNA recognition motif-containing protein